VDKLEEEKAALEKEKEGWEAERKRLASWRVRCLDSEEKLNKRIREAGRRLRGFEGQVRWGCWGVG